MVSKDQEFQALEKIREIVKDLGENSYIGAAMDGVLKVASENIIYDAAFSLTGKIQVAEKEVERLNTENEGLKKQLKRSADRCDKLNEKLNYWGKIANNRKIPDNMMVELMRLINDSIKQSDNELSTESEAMMSEVQSCDQISNQLRERAREFRENTKKQSKRKAVRDFLENYIIMEEEQ